ncbi:ArsR family transcriptional regulator [Halapricum salinum]|uniref:Transcriptional regulator TrmB n=1 Tax=Halapricum salinum TaxID=1457250 RepID=A0A4D6HG56_9EURY|nr:ArsR family transcriptional regulator [Halapricum salinum]QCC51757.1 transcriptional regulator TrmB [Halapricum salinum]
MLSRIELEVLATTKRGNTISDIAGELGYSESYVSRAVSNLTEKGLCYTKRDGRRKRVSPSDARTVEVYQNLVQEYSHIDFPDLLTGKSLEVLYYLDQPRTVTEIADASDNYRNTVNRVLKRFRDRGLVGADDGRYQFNKDFHRLHEFARELAHHLHRQRLDGVTSRGTILWEGYDEFLAQTETEIDAEAFHETGLARFATFGLQFLLTGKRYYFYSEQIDAIEPPDLCCHTLLIDDGTRHQSYCLLLLSHIEVDADALRETASKYGLETEIDALLRYLQNSGDVGDNRLPEWSAFEELAADYGVTVPQ